MKTGRIAKISIHTLFISIKIYDITLHAITIPTLGQQKTKQCSNRVCLIYSMI